MGDEIRALQSFSRLTFQFDFTVRPAEMWRSNQIILKRFGPIRRSAETLFSQDRKHWIVRQERNPNGR